LGIDSPGVLSIKGDGNLVITDVKGTSLTVNSENNLQKFQPMVAKTGLDIDKLKHWN
jgi:hypothetical protein